MVFKCLKFRCKHHNYKTSTVNQIFDGCSKSFMFIGAGPSHPSGDSSILPQIVSEFSLVVCLLVFAHHCPLRMELLALQYLL